MASAVAGEDQPTMLKLVHSLCVYGYKKEQKLSTGQNLFRSLYGDGDANQTRDTCGKNCKIIRLLHWQT